MPQSRFITLRRRCARLFDDGLKGNQLAARVDAALVLLIAINVTSVVLESVGPLREHYDASFRLVEEVATGIFAAEYLLRLWTAVDLSSGRFRHPIAGRLAYMRGFFPIIDLISVLPAVLGLLGAADLRVLRLLRLLRMLKLTRHSTVFGLLWSVLREEARSIAALLFIILLTLTMSGSLMYMIEGDVQPAAFSSIPAAMWWAIETLTTVGYGDIVPVTVAGKILGGIVSVVGVGTLALFSGLITASFVDQLRLRRQQLRRVVAERLAAGPLSPRIETDLVHIAERLDLSRDVAEAVIEERRATCPHCGGILAPPGS